MVLGFFFLNVHLNSYSPFFPAQRGQFEEMAADVFARVEAPLQSLLEQTSEYYFPQLC